MLITKMVAACAASHPDRRAIVACEHVLTYRQLVMRAQVLAARLQELGVGRESVVASCLPGNAASAVAVLGIWAAGGAYLPVDPSAAPDRADHMVRDSRAAIAVRAEGDEQALADCVRDYIELSDTGEIAGAAAIPAFTGHQGLPGDLAYVMYTSGSTGRPKGVMVEHGHLAAMAEAHEATLFRDSRRDIRHVALNNLPTADSFFSDFVHLAYGRTVHVVETGTRRDPERLAHFIARSGIEVFDATPTQVRSLVLAGFTEALASLKVLILGGEATSPELWNLIRGLPGVEAYNMYGPTECTVDVTAAALRDHAAPVIGTPLPGNRVMVVDEDARPVPDGEIGELCILGRQVARGYVSDQPSARRVFMEFAPEPGSVPVRAYLTGDRGRYDDAGCLEFRGRNDDQVSINGYRVELGEIRASLRGCAGVLDAAVAFLSDQTPPTIVAWVVLDIDATLEHVREQLISALPAHMRPRLAATPAIPIGSTGKADTAELVRRTASFVGDSSDGSEGGIGDEQAVSAVIRRTWQEMLGLDAIAADDDFFALGGDSFAATQTTVALREALLPDLPMRLIFDESRFEDFCRTVVKLVDEGGRHDR
jgi:amino acid adenylation domain-containing protein